jgi:hypothetical protein
MVVSIRLETMGKTKKALVRIIGNTVEIRTWRLPKTCAGLTATESLRNGPQVLKSCIKFQHSDHNEKIAYNYYSSFLSNHGSFVLLTSV